MEKKNMIISVLVIVIAIVLVIASAIVLTTDDSEDKNEYVQGIALDVDGESYYFSGPQTGTSGKMDIPGHEWKVIDATTLEGKHYNTGPDGAVKWWSSDAKNGALLYTVEAKIDIWTPAIAEDYASQGFIHYHELAKVSDGTMHESKVVWLKHTAETDFTLDGGPAPELSHAVTKGVDLKFIPNYMTAYDEGESFTQGIVIDVDGEDCYFSGPALGPDDEKDIPGHYWSLESSTTLTGKHYNTGPDGASKWWSSDADDGALLYTVEAVIDTWTPAKSDYYSTMGFIHYHELVKVSDGSLHDSKIVWLKHTAETGFTLDGGPHPELSHAVTPGVDLEFIPNYMTAYDEGESFTQGIVIDLDGEDYYFSGPALGPDDEKDIPGHYWSMESPTTLIGKHYNTGPDGTAKWWSSDADNGTLLYTVEAKIDIWTPAIAEDYASQGFIHYHELAEVSNGSLHDSKIVWLKHTAETGFTLDGGPHPELSHAVTPGVDLEFIPNYMTAYDEGESFTQGIVIDLDGEDYYFSGPALGPDDEKDIPGHYWSMESPTTLTGKHYNTGPDGTAKWWSSDADNGTLLYTVEAVIDTWTPAKSDYYATMGFIHYHELVKVSDGSLHDSKIVWLKHTAETGFTLDGGPHPELSHAVTPGVDLEFIPNYMTPYVGSNTYTHGIVVDVDGTDYYFSGPADGPGGEMDIPGHEWVIHNATTLWGRHLNVGPYDASQWWSSDAENNSLLYVVYAVIDDWSTENFMMYADLGYIHYHELAKVSDSLLHPTKVVWLKHIALADFTLDGGPHPELSHAVTKGVDSEFVPNYFMPYTAGVEFVHGIAIDVDGVDYYLDGPADGPGGSLDIPGHKWVSTGAATLYGLHYNIGPFNASMWWSSAAANNTLLYVVEAVIDTWTSEKADSYYSDGFVHYHEMVKVTNTTEYHPTKVVWLRHIAIEDFDLDGGPHPELGHLVSEGIDTEFIPNYDTPYP